MHVLRSFEPYVAELERLSGGYGRDTFAELAPHLDGEAGRRLRGAVPIEDLRRLGAFFTGEALASRVVELVSDHTESYVDPACGCGDLLLAASARLSVRKSLEDTLKEWNERLIGRDLVPEFIRAARARLVLAALTRGARMTARGTHPAELLTNIAVGDGTALRPRRGAAVLVNPPYGQVVAPPDRTWTNGLTTEAAVFLDSLLDACAPGVQVAAVLPEVLRAGSRYGRFRATVERRMEVMAVEPAGIFDALTDVDVFLLAGRIAADAAIGLPTNWTAPVSEARLQDVCDVRVGAVVANRDPHRGPWRLYVDARDLAGRAVLRPTRHRRFRGSVLDPPFVVVGRTNRPVLHGPRVRATVVLGDRPIAVENHLIALVPHDHTHRACEALVTIVEAERASRFLDERLRCRHLTVRALRDVPR